MNLRVVGIWMVGLLSIGSLCNAVGAEEGAKPPPQITTTVKVYRDPPVDLASRKLYVEFADSPRLTGMFRETLASRGYNMAASEEDSDAKIRFIGYVGIGLFATTPKKATLAEVIEKSMFQPAGKDEAEVSRTSMADVAVMDAAAKRLAPSFRGGLNATNLAEWIGDVTGLRGAFNTLIAGDPRGFCMHENCSKYQQRIVVGASGEASWLVTLSALSEEIVLDRLVEESLVRALEPLQAKVLAE